MCGGPTHRPTHRFIDPHASPMHRPASHVIAFDDQVQVGEGGPAVEVIQHANCGQVPRPPAVGQPRYVEPAANGLQPRQVQPP